MKTRITQLSNSLNSRYILLLLITVTVFSTINIVDAQPLKVGQSVVTSFDPVHPLYNCVKVLDVRNRPPFVAGGNFWNPNSFTGPNWNHQRMGNVYGITLDDQDPPNIFVARSTVYCGMPDTSTGLIYKIDRLTWAVSNYVVRSNVAGPTVTGVNTIPNTGPALGNLCFDSWHHQIFTTNHEDGKIYRVMGAATGIVQSAFDPFTGDPGTSSGFVVRGERLWGIGVYGTSSTDVRVYYGRWRSDRSAPGGGANQIWSVALDFAGEFVAGSVRLEITIPFDPSLSYSNPVSDIEFSATGTMLIGERTMNGDMGPCVADGNWAHQSRILEFPRNSGLYSNTLFTKHKVGLLSNTNSAGGVDFTYGYSDSVSKVNAECDTNIVGTGDYLYNRPSFGLVYGVQYFDKNFQGNPNFSHYIDLNGAYGTGDKTTPGDIDVYRRDSCSCRSAADLWMQDDAADVGAEPYVKTPFWASPDIWVSYVPNGPEKTPEYGQLNYVNVRIRNKGLSQSCGGVLTLQWAKSSAALAWSKPWFGTEFFNTVYPMGGSLGSRVIPNAAAGSSNTVMSFQWYPPNPANYSSNHTWNPGHFCLLARIEAVSVAPYGLTETPILKNNVNWNNNISMRNVDVYDLYKFPRPTDLDLFVGNYAPFSMVKKIELKGLTASDSAAVTGKITFKARLADSLYRLWAIGGKHGSNVIEQSDSSIIFLGSGSYIANLNLPSNSNYPVSWRVIKNNISDSLFLPEYNFDVMQIDESSDEADGGNRITLRPKTIMELNLKFNFEACPTAKAVRVELRRSVSPYDLIDSVTSMGGGNIALTFNFTAAVNGVPYYIVIRDNNSIETWSALPVIFTSDAVSYDFTTGRNKAYGSNQKLVSGIASIYQGDTGQDGNIDLTDVISVYNFANAFATNSIVDLNADGITDLTDVIYASNNSNAFVQVIWPR